MSSDARAMWLLWLPLALLVAAWAAFAFAPSMWGWGLDVLRFVSPVPGWALWTLATLALIPALARRALPALVAAGSCPDARSTGADPGGW